MSTIRKNISNKTQQLLAEDVVECASKAKVRTADQEDDTVNKKRWLTAREEQRIRYNVFRAGVFPPGPWTTMINCAHFCATELNYPSALHFLMPCDDHTATKRGRFCNDGTTRAMTIAEGRVLRRALDREEGIILDHRLIVDPTTRNKMTWKAFQGYIRTMRKIFAELGYVLQNKRRNLSRESIMYSVGMRFSLCQSYEEVERLFNSTNKFWAYNLDETGSVFGQVGQQRPANSYPLRNRLRDRTITQHGCTEDKIRHEKSVKDDEEANTAATAHGKYADDNNEQEKKQRNDKSANDVDDQEEDASRNGKNTSSHNYHDDKASRAGESTTGLNEGKTVDAKDRPDVTPGVHDVVVVNVDKERAESTAKRTSTDCEEEHDMEDDTEEIEIDPFDKQRAKKKMGYKEDDEEWEFSKQIDEQRAAELAGGGKHEEKDDDEYLDLKPAKRPPRKRKLKRPPLTKEEMAFKKKRNAEMKERNRIAKMKCYSAPDQDSDNDNEVGYIDDRPTLEEALKRADVVIYRGPPAQALLFEDLMAGKIGTPGSSWKQDFDDLDAIWILIVTAQGVYTFIRSYEVYHQEIGLMERDARGLTEYECVRELAKKRGVDIHEIKQQGQSLSNKFLKVAHDGSDEFAEISKDLRLDAPRVLETMLRMKDEGDPHLLGGTEDEDNTDRCDKRGTLHVNIGYANRSHNQHMPAECCSTTANAPVMQTWETDDHRFLYNAGGPVADMLQNFMDRNNHENGEPYGDNDRSNRFGKRFRRAMRAKRSRLEALTFAATKLGKLIDLENGVSNRSHKLLRHFDGPDDMRPGYSITAVYWILMVVGEDVWRLAMIGYSRKAIGETLDKERTWLKPASDKLQEHASKYNLKDYNSVKAEDLDEEEWFRVGERQMIALIRKTYNMANPMGAFSGIIDAISYIQQDYPDLTYRNHMELLYTSLLQTNATTFNLIVRRWRRGGENPLPLSDDGALMVCNLHMRFIDECQKIGLKPGSSAYSRYQYSWGHKDNPYPGYIEQKESDTNEELESRKQEALDFVNSQLDLLESIVIEANRGADHCIVMERLRESMKSIGGVLSLPFYSVCVHTGLIFTEGGKQQSMRAAMPQNSPFRDFLKKDLGVTGKDVDKVVDRLAFHFGVSEFTIENLGCKTFRNGDKYDTFVIGQRIYNRMWKHANGKATLVLVWRLLDEVEWKEYSPQPVNSPNCRSRRRGD